MCLEWRDEGSEATGDVVAQADYQARVTQDKKESHREISQLSNTDVMEQLTRNQTDVLEGMRPNSGSTPL